jgi:hypothetical protein
MIGVVGAYLRDAPQNKNVSHRFQNTEIVVGAYLRDAPAGTILLCRSGIARTSGKNKEKHIRQNKNINDRLMVD